MHKRYNRPTTINDKGQRGNLIVNMDDLSEVMTTDITYIQLTDKTWVYITSAYDPEDRKVLSYQITDTMTAPLAISVVANTRYLHGNIGGQYTSKLFENTLGDVGIRHS